MSLFDSPDLDAPLLELAPPPPPPRAAEGRRRVHFSDLKVIRISPLAYRDQERFGVKVTPPMRIGTAVHRLILGGPRPVVWDGKVRRGRQWEDWIGANAFGVPEDEILSAAEWSAASRAVEALEESELAREYLAGTQRETALTWTLGGVPCGTRGVDAWTPGDRWGDLKTTGRDLQSIEWWAKAQCWTEQIAWYGMGLAENGYREWRRPPWLLVVQTVRPFDVAVLHVSPSALADARERCLSWLATLEECRATDRWPGLYPRPITLDGQDAFEVTDPDEDRDDETGEVAA